MSKEKAVRDAAAALKTAIAEAEAAGYRVDWPANAGGLGAIGISETGRMKAAPAPQAEPATAEAVAETGDATKPRGKK